MDDWFLADLANKISKHFAETRKEEHFELMKGYFDVAEVVIGVLPVHHNAPLEKLVLKGAARLREIKRIGKAEEMSVVVFSVRTLEQAVAMSRVFGDNSL